MKSKKLILALTMTCLIGLGVTTYASADSATTNNLINSCHHHGSELRNITGIKGSDYAKSVLKNKLGLSDKEIDQAIKSGKSIYDLAKEKGMTKEQFKAALLEEKFKAIDKAVADGKITKSQGDSLKETVKNSMNSCDRNHIENSNKNQIENKNN